MTGVKTSSKQDGILSVAVYYEDALVITSLACRSSTATNDQSRSLH